MDKNISNSTKDIELLEFKAGGNSYGADINDIREILPYSSKPTPIPNSHPFLEGMIMPRDFIIPIINFGASILLDKQEEAKTTDNTAEGSLGLGKNEDMLIVTSIGNHNIAFHVDSVRGIHRFDPSLVEEPGRKLTTKQKNVISGIYKTEDRRIEIVDFRQIIKNINQNVTVD